MATSTRRRSAASTKGKKKLTPEQRAEFAEKRKAEVQGLQEQLTAAVVEFASSEGWAALLKKMAQRSRIMRKYSFRNSALIFAQCPHATDVRGYNEWKGRGRQVRKGERGIRILAPNTVTPRDENGEPQKDEHGNEKRITIFKPISVFDVSQTERAEGAQDPEAEPAGDVTLPEIGAKVQGTAPAEFMDRLTRCLKSLGYMVERGDTAPADGYADPATRTVRIGLGFPEAHAAAVLAHEAGHVQLDHTADMAEYRQHRGRMETEAESVAFIVCAVAGLDSSVSSLSYIAGWAGKTPEKVQETMVEVGQRVVEAARAILAFTDPDEDQGEETGEPEAVDSEAEAVPVAA
ncbi:ArdC-like ssDNA-binding domain-containing protein [Streptomyces sp. NRRL S-146]|uniref:ArdC-like ssDNA-binding domain-containing protein n=1 Tax=Streptomyces sp. NRRL S-146 TaxID=1463884 RepID=UPI00068D480B|nr:ArdC-like ssDNA-binding domain-containing protein [Streptomyces sp. NRRL S-146]